MCFLYAGYDATVRSSITTVAIIAMIRVRPWHRRVEMPANIVAITRKPMRPDGEITISAGNINITDVANSARAD